MKNMELLNDNFAHLSGNYLFTEVKRRVEAFRAAHPEMEIIRMDIGDVTRPICPASVEAMHRAVDDMADPERFRGYGPEQGYGFLREAIALNDYAARGVKIDPDDIFIGDGAKSDTGNFGDILSLRCRVAVTDPVYPVYVDTNVMGGRMPVIHMPATEQNDFVPDFPTATPDVIYLCSPNNPTGTAMSRSRLAQWVDYASRIGALILFDSAYEAFVTDPDVPRSIYEIEGAEEIAVEFRSFSKTAGFTGLRCGYTVVPRELKGEYSDGRKASLRDLWLRRQSTKFNGASYVVQRGAEAIYSPEGKKQIASDLDYYHRNAVLFREGLSAAGFTAYGGVNSPYVWVKAPGGASSRDFFDRLLSVGVTSTPGSGFGACGEGFVRFTAFNTEENTRKAVKRIAEAGLF